MEKRFINVDFNCLGFTLSGVLHLPEAKNPPLVVGSHGFEGTKASAKQMVLAQTLPPKGIAFFRFDHRGCGQSQGNFLTETSLEKRRQDLIYALDHVLSLGVTSSRIALFGSSMGGAAIINAWESIQKKDLTLCGAVLCSAPLQSLTIEKIPTQANGDRPALPLSFFAENLLFDLTPQARELSNLLIFHGDADEVVPVSNAHNIYKLAKDPKQLIIHANGDHPMSSEQDQEDFNLRSADWFSRCFKR